MRFRATPRSKPMIRLMFRTAQIPEPRNRGMETDRQTKWTVRQALPQKKLHNTMTARRARGTEGIHPMSPCHCCVRINTGVGLGHRWKYKLHVSQLHTGQS